MSVAAERVLQQRIECSRKGHYTSESIDRSLRAFIYHLVLLVKGVPAVLYWRLKPIGFAQIDMKSWGCR